MTNKQIDTLEADIAAIRREIKALQTEGASHSRDGKHMNARQVQTRIAYLVDVLDKLMDRLDAVAG